MANALWLCGRHTRVATVVAVVGVLVSISQLAQWPATNNGNNVNAALVTVIVSAAAVDVLYAIARRFDRSHPQPRLHEAIVRLFLPVLVCGVVAAWTMEAGLFARSDTAWLPIFGSSIAAVVVMRVVLRGAAESASTGQPDSATPHRVAAPPGPPHWPMEPPTEPPAAAVVHASAPPPARSRWHLLTSAIISVAWVPLGLVVLFLANYCPDEGTGDAVLVASIAYVVTQLVGNPIAGWMLDRRFGTSGGVMLAIGRSVAVAVVLMIGMGIIAGLLVPDGTSRYCG